MCIMRLWGLAWFSFNPKTAVLYSMVTTKRRQIEMAMTMAICLSRLHQTPTCARSIIPYTKTHRFATDL